MLHENHRLHYMYTRLYRAWQEDEFRLHFQTLVDADRRRLAGFEALVRWYDKSEDRIIQPGEFLPFAEDTGLIVLIGDWILREACRQARLWNRLSSSTVVVAVNLAPVQLLDVDLVEQVEAAIEGLPAGALKLEIPEQCLVEHARAARSPLQKLKSLGVQLAIDEFGAGYSSIPALIRFPYDEIKLSRRFIAKLQVLPEARVLAAEALAVVVYGDEAAVFDYLADFSNAEEWDPNVKDACWITQKKPNATAGDAFRVLS